MKHIVLIFSLVIIFLMMVVMIINHQEKPPMRLLSTQKYYSYLYEDEKQMQVVLYINDLTHPIVNQESYESINLSNLDQTKNLEMTLNKVTLDSEEVYLNETYMQMTLFMEIPNLNQDFQIEDLYLEIHLVNEDAYFISLGSLSLIYTLSNSDYLDWTALDGLKNASFFISRLGEVTIEYQTLDQEIEKILIGYNYEAEFSIYPDSLVLTIPFENLLLDEIPVIIYFQSGHVQTIANFRYMFNYQILKESGLLINTYALN